MTSSAGSRSRRLGGLPVTLVDPDGPPRGTALCLPYLAGTVERVRPALDALAAAGLLAVAFDPWQQGDRADREPEAHRDHLLGAFRREMWPVLGMTTLEAAWLLDQLLAEGAPEPLVAGGLSMGGDVAVALAGIDPRVRRVAAVGSTPDWTRPGMRELLDPGTVADQGEPGAAGAFLAASLNPVDHVGRYAAAGTAIRFECGGADHHVPHEAAQRFAAALPGQVEVSVLPGLDHGSLFGDAGAFDRTIAFLAAAG